LGFEREVSAFIVWSVERGVTLCLVVYIQKSDFHLINIFCVENIVKKCIMASPGDFLVFCTA